MASTGERQRSTFAAMGVTLPDLDLRLLRSFIVVAEELHFGRAADRLGIAQPPLSQQIKRLEDKVGCDLFFRRSRKVSLTEAGKSLLGTSYRIFEQLGLGLDATRRAGRGETGKLRVAFPASVALTIIPKIIREYCSKFPDARLELLEMPTTPQIEALHAGTIDIGFLRDPHPDDALVFETVFEEQFIAVLPRMHPLAGRRRLELKHLAEQNFVFFPRAIGNNFHDRAIAYCRSAGFEPRIVERASEWQTIAALVEAGLGVSIAPACIMRVQLDDVTYRRFAKSDLVTSVVMGRRSDSGEPLIRRFLEVAHDVALAQPVNAGVQSKNWPRSYIPS